MMNPIKIITAPTRRMGIRIVIIFAFGLKKKMSNIPLSTHFSDR